MRDGSGWGEVRGQRAEVRLKRFVHLCNLTSDLCNHHYSRYSLGWRKKCDNRFDGRNSIVYVTLRRNFTCNLTQPRRLPVALSFIVSARCQSLKFRLAIP